MVASDTGWGGGGPADDQEMLKRLQRFQEGQYGVNVRCTFAKWTLCQYFNVGQSSAALILSGFIFAFILSVKPFNP